MMNWINKFEIIVLLFLMISSGKVLSLSSRLQGCMQNAGAYIEM
jgi:hypothetical protein